MLVKTWIWFEGRGQVLEYKFDFLSVNFSQVLNMKPRDESWLKFYKLNLSANYAS